MATIFSVTLLTTELIIETINEFSYYAISKNVSILFENMNLWFLNFSGKCTSIYLAFWFWILNWLAVTWCHTFHTSIIKKFPSINFEMSAGSLASAHFNLCQNVLYNVIASSRSWCEYYQKPCKLQIFKY